MITWGLLKINNYDCLWKWRSVIRNCKISSHPKEHTDSHRLRNPPPRPLRLSTASAHALDRKLDSSHV